MEANEDNEVAMADQARMEDDPEPPHGDFEPPQGDLEPEHPSGPATIEGMMPLLASLQEDSLQPIMAKLNKEATTPLYDVLGPCKS